MMDLPDWASPDAVEPFAIPFGNWLTPPTGGEELFVERMGGRFGAKIGFPALAPDLARVLISRLTDAWFSGATVRVAFPLAGVSQGIPATPVVDGAGQSGKSIAMRGLTPGYAAKEGFWLTLVDENGRGYLHNNRALAVAGADGKATLSLSPMVRWPFANGATVRLARPTLEGKVAAEPWSLPKDRLVRVGFELREVA